MNTQCQPVNNRQHIFWVACLLLLMSLVQMPSAMAEPATKTEAEQSGKTTAAQKPYYPKRGMTMKQVRKQHGKPASTRVSKGKNKRRWPKITVWNYGRFSVYFERHLVLHTVVH